jgi:hypothetical protein
MANEIQINATLRYSKSPTAASLSTSFFADQTGDKFQAGVQIVGITEEQLNKGDVGTIGYLAFRNLDTTNFVELGKATGAYSIKVKPGKGGVIPWGSSAVYMLADTAAVEFEYLAIEA